jgi:hypothetical protein
VGTARVNKQSWRSKDPPKATNRDVASTGGFWWGKVAFGGMAPQIFAKKCQNPSLQTHHD